MNGVGNFRFSWVGKIEIPLRAGSVRIAEQDLLAGGRLFSEAREAHHVLALPHAIIFVSAEGDADR